MKDDEWDDQSFHSPVWTLVRISSQSLSEEQVGGAVDQQDKVDEEAEEL